MWVLRSLPYFLNQSCIRCFKTGAFRRWRFVLEEKDLHDDGRDGNWEERSARSSGDAEATEIELLELLPEKLESSAQQACSDWDGNRGGIVGGIDEEGEERTREMVLLRWYQYRVVFIMVVQVRSVVATCWCAPKDWNRLTGATRS